YILSIIDVYSKFGICKPLLDRSSASVVNEMNFFYLFGAPEILQCDNGKEFKNSSMNDLCQFWKIKRIFGRPRYPQSQGQVERFNQCITRMISKNIYKKDK
ncbi:Pro-Pol polyprotein, partial [Dictyocoela muelleri]